MLGASREPCAVLDLDAFYSSNAGLILTPLSGDSLSEIRIPAPGSNIETEFSKLFETKQNVVIIDSLNTLYHLISMEDGNSRARKLAFALASLSYFARANAKVIILSMYRREGFSRLGRAKSISDLSDVTAFVELKGHDLTIRTERGVAWQSGGFSIRSL